MEVGFSICASLPQRYGSWLRRLIAVNAHSLMNNLEDLVRVPGTVFFGKAEGKGWGIGVCE